MVVALVRIHGEIRQMFDLHWFLILLASFRASLVIVAAAHFGF